MMKIAIFQIKAYPEKMSNIVVEKRPPKSMKPRKQSWIARLIKEEIRGTSNRWINRKAETTTIGGRNVRRNGDNVAN